MVKHRVFLFLGLARNYKSVVFPGLVLNLVYLTGGTILLIRISIKAGVMVCSLELLRLDSGHSSDDDGTTNYFYYRIKMYKCQSRFCQNR